MGKQTSKMKPKNFSELAEATSFMQEDLVKWYKGFVLAYPNRSLSIEDFKKIYGHHFPFGDASEFAQHVFRQFDLNGDGIIDFREFVIWLSVTIPSTTEDRLKRAFALYDIDGNGFVSKQEMTNIVQSIHKMVGIVDESNAKRCVDDIFGRMDVNIDGKLSISEFVEGTKEDVVTLSHLQCDWETTFMHNLIHDSKTKI